MRCPMQPRVPNSLFTYQGPKRHLTVIYDTIFSHLQNKKETF